MSQLLKNLKETQQYHEVQADPLAKGTHLLDDSPLEKKSIVLRWLIIFFALTFCIGIICGLSFIVLSFETPLTEQPTTPIDSFEKLAIPKTKNNLSNSFPAEVKKSTETTLETKGESQLPGNPEDVLLLNHLPTMQCLDNNLTSVSVQSKVIPITTKVLTFATPLHRKPFTHYSSTPSLGGFIYKYPIKYAKERIGGFISPGSFGRLTHFISQLTKVNTPILPSDSPTFVNFLGQQITKSHFKKYFWEFPTPEQLAYRYLQWSQNLQQRMTVKQPQPSQEKIIIELPAQQATRLAKKTVRTNPQNRYLLTSSSQVNTQKPSQIQPRFGRHLPSIQQQPEPPAFPQNPLVVKYLEAVKIASIRIDGSQSKVKLGNDVYYIQSIVSPELKLKLIDITPQELVFSDENNTKYIKKISE